MKNKIKNKMKNIWKILLLAICVVAFTECSTSLDEEPEGLLSPASFFVTKSDFEAAIIGNYRPLFGAYDGFDFWTGVVPGAGAEDISAAYALNKPFDVLNVSPGDTYTILKNWTNFYKVINNANTIIGNLDRAEFTGAALDAYEGQAKFLRALGYFLQTRYYGEVPLITEENLEDAANIGQSPVADIYNQIVNDLKDAENLLPLSFPEKGKATKGAAKAMLAEVYLTMAGWPINDASNYALARDKAKEVMNLGVYSLERDYMDLWLADNKTTNSEFQFTLMGIGTGGWIPGSHLHVACRPYTGGESGWADFFSEHRFFEAFPDGYRKDISFHSTFADGSYYLDLPPNQPFVAKYRDAGSACGYNDPSCASNGEGFWVMLRYAQTLLIYAEAANMASGGPTAEALEAINMVRRRANNLDPNVPDATVDLTTMSQAAFDDAVIAERAWELAFEGHRWFDLVRKQMVVEVNKELHPNVSATNRLLPKPISQVLLTEGLEQNPGY